MSENETEKKRKRKEKRKERQVETEDEDRMARAAHLGTFQILVVGLGGVAHGLDGLVVDVEAE